MAPDSFPPSAASDSPVLAAPPRLKFRVRFRKAGDLRLVSHHDLMHIFERTFRRADLALATTQGFNPRPRMWFALSLALGVAGLREVLELEISHPLSAEEIAQRLSAHAPPGIEILSVRAIDVRASAHVLRSWHRLPIPAELSIDNCQLSIVNFLQQSDSWIERTRPRRRRINLRPFVSELHLRDGGLEFALWISPTGAARPEEVVAAVGLASLLEDGAVLERTDLEIVDELPAGANLQAPALDTAFAETPSDDRLQPAESIDPARPTAIIGDPLAFDS